MKIFALLIMQTALSFLEVFEAILKVMLLSTFKNNIPKIYSDQSNIAVLGNAPGMYTDLKNIMERHPDVEIMVCNFFCFDDLFFSLKPKYYAICDPDFTMSTGKELITQRTKFYDILFSKVTWKMYLFVPFLHRKHFLQLIKNHNWESEHITFIFYNTTNFNSKTKLIQRLYERQLGMPSPQNVIIAALMLACLMNYKCIHIAGVKLNVTKDLIVSAENQLMVRQTHFYSDRAAEVVYEPFRKPNMEPFSVSEFFKTFYKTFDSFDCVASFAKTQNIQIVNYTEDSLLDQFERYQPKKDLRGLE